LSRTFDRAITPDPAQPRLIGIVTENDRNAITLDPTGNARQRPLRV
jgi:hypothetical protein